MWAYQIFCPAIWHMRRSWVASSCPPSLISANFGVTRNHRFGSNATFLPLLSSFSPGQFVQRPPIRLSRRRVSQVLVSQLFRAIFYSLCFPHKCQQGCFPLIGSLLRFERQQIYLKINHCTFRSNIPLNALTVLDHDWRYRQVFAVVITMTMTLI